MVPEASGCRTIPAGTTLYLDVSSAPLPQTAADEDQQPVQLLRMRSTRATSSATELTFSFFIAFSRRASMAWEDTESL